MNPEHYICRGCKTVHDADGVCETKKCAKKDEALEMCDCPDGWHKGAFEDDEWDPIEI